MKIFSILEKHIISLIQLRTSSKILHLFSLFFCSASLTSPAEKKQMSMVSASYDILREQMNRNEISPEVMQKIAILVDALGNRNFPAASQVQGVRYIYNFCTVTVILRQLYVYECIFCCCLGFG